MKRLWVEFSFSLLAGAYVLCSLGLLHRHLRQQSCYAEVSLLTWENNFKLATPVTTLGCNNKVDEPQATMERPSHQTGGEAVFTSH